MIDPSSDIENTVRELVAKLLDVYDSKVPDSGPFADVRVKEQIYFGDPAISQPGMLEIAILNMDESLNPQYRQLRFVAVRVKKSPQGGAVSSTCFHGVKAALRHELEKEAKQPSLLMDRITELASGLPEETNSNVWR